MKLFNIFKKKQIQPISLKKLSFKQRMALRAINNNYIAKVAITYNDKPIRHFETTVIAPSKKIAKSKMETGFGIEVLEINRKK